MDPRFADFEKRIAALEAVVLKKQPKAEAAVAPLAGAKRASAKKEGK